MYVYYKIVNVFIQGYDFWDKYKQLLYNNLIVHTFFFLFKLAIYMKNIHNLYIFFIKKNVQVSKAIAQSSFQNAKNVFVKPLECLMSGFTSSLFQ